MTDPEPHLPDDLIADLSALYARKSPVPPAMDAAILTEARRRAGRVRQLRLLLRWGGGAAAMAAMLLVALRLIPTGPPKFNPQAHVTILDAFSLARQLKQNVKPDRSWDVTGDGVADQRDVEALAARAVALPKGGVQ